MSDSTDNVMVVDEVTTPTLEIKESNGVQLSGKYVHPSTKLYFFNTVSCIM